MISNLGMGCLLCLKENQKEKMGFYQCQGQLFDFSKDDNFGSSKNQISKNLLFNNLFQISNNIFSSNKISNFFTGLIILRP